MTAAGKGRKGRRRGRVRGRSEVFWVMQLVGFELGRQEEPSRRDLAGEEVSNNDTL